jgi:hypothetical protein
LEVRGTAWTGAGSGEVLRWRSADDGATWTRAGAASGAATTSPQERGAGPDVLAERTARARILTLTSRRGEPRLFLEIRPAGQAGHARQTGQAARAD